MKRSIKLLHPIMIMVVLDYIPSVVGDEDYPMAEVIARLHDTDKMVIAYIDIGEAESYRVYWQDGWRVGDPAWIVGEDPDGWAENYPVAFWDLRSGRRCGWMRAVCWIKSERSGSMVSIWIGSRLIPMRTWSRRRSAKASILSTR